MTLSSFLVVGDGFENSPGSMLVASGGLLVVTNDETDIGGYYESSGNLTVSGASFLAKDIFLGGARSGGDLIINSGTVTLSGQLGIGYGGQGSGSVSLDGGKLVVTNGETHLGLGTPSDGSLAVSDGLFLARDVYVGAFESSATFLINGGTSILSSNLQIGGGVFWRDCFDNRRPTVRYKCSNRSNQNLSRRNSGIHCFRRPIGGKDHRIERFFWR
jgi:hypothetical protein